MTQGKAVAVVTGAARGLGAALAQEAGRRGMAVVLADRDEAGLAEIERKLQHMGITVLAVPTDVGEPKSIDALAAATEKRFGSTALLINNAGLDLVGKIWEFSADAIDRIMRVNVLGAMHAVRAFAPSMIASKSACRIVNVSSLGALGAMPLQTSYIVSKQAVLAYSEGLELEFQQFAPHVRVSVVLPGPVDTSIFEPPVSEDRLSAGFRSAMRDMLARQGLPAEEAARQIMAQVDEGHFWVSCHPQQLALLAREKARRLADLREPFLDEAGMALMAAVIT